MATDKRISDQGTVFNAGTVRSFLLMALGHDAVVDPVSDLLFEHVMEHKHDPSVVATSLKPIIDEALDVATFDDWDWAARALTAEACEALGVELPINGAPGAQPPQTPETRRSWRNLDPGELREKLAEIHARDKVSHGAAMRAWLITRKVSRLTGIDREQIEADARTDAEAIKATGDDGKASTDQSEREQVIETARKLDPQIFKTDVRGTHPGKYEGESDLLAVALDVINGHGLADESAGETATSGYAWRVRRFVGIEDSQGFVTAEEYPTTRQAIERLRDFDVPTKEKES